MTHMERDLNTLPDESSTRCPILNNGAFLRLMNLFIYLMGQKNAALFRAAGMLRAAITSGWAFLYSTSVVVL
jgi:hypothetical protein